MNEVNNEKKLRTFFFVPANKIDLKMPMAFDNGTDAIILDLEDSVNPKERIQARESIKAWVKTIKPNKLPFKVFIRVNQINTIDYFRDIEMLLDESIAEFSKIVYSLLLPKGQVFLDTVEIVNNKVNRQIPITPLIESKLGFKNIDQVTNGLTSNYVFFGGRDTAADYGIARESLTHNALKTRFVMACKENDKYPIDSPFYDAENLNKLCINNQELKDNGFEGRMIVYPQHIKPTQAMFVPSQFEIEQAQQILLENKKGTSKIGGMFVDEAIARKARQTLIDADLSHLINQIEKS